MTRRSNIWLAVATVFTLVNFGGIWMAARMMPAEEMHTGLHVVLTIVGAWWMWRIVERSRQGGPAAIATQRLDQLQDSVDAIAIEVERIGEAQRFATKIAAERVAPPQPPQKPAP